MRRRFGAVALATVSLLLVGPLAAGAAHADVTTSVSADDLFFPDGTTAPAPDAGSPGAKDSGRNDSSDDANAPGAAAVNDSTTSGDDRELALARGSRAQDLLGWMPSLYQGKWYVPAREDVRKCIMDRESNFSYRAVGAGTYFGAYQMNAGLARGATFIMEKEVANEMGPAGAAVVQALRKTTPNNWNRYWQDRAFWTIWRAGAGAGHWRGGGLNCF